mmetsp:Transcript_35831/g.86207  ORF Transcript_35831/g.86207 Transcript_35831/m.86207 type:complete len:241 (+) Transcript_35831:1-723(+)
MVLLAPAAVMFGVQVVNWLGAEMESWMGIHPRTWEGFLQIFTAPFCHLSWAHLTANLTGWFILGAVTMLNGRRCYVMTCCFVAVVGGLLVVICGRNAIHAGASGVLFGLFAFQLTAVCFQPQIEWKSVVGLLVAAVVFGGMIFGVLPTDATVSWESHLFGAAAGVLFAWLYFKKIPHKLQGPEGPGSKAPAPPGASASAQVPGGRVTFTTTPQNYGRHTEGEAPAAPPPSNNPFDDPSRV